MHDFFKMMRQYASPYKGYLAGAVVLNMLSAIFNILTRSNTPSFPGEPRA